MKKALFFVGCALFVASMVSCGNKAVEEAVDSTPIDTVAEEVVEEVAPVTEEPVAVAAVDKTEMLNAAKEAGQAKCNCYKNDPASVESCIRALLNERYAAYQNDSEFQAAMKAEYEKCIKEKVAAKGKEVGDKAIKAGADALSKKLQGKN